MVTDGMPGIPMATMETDLPGTGTIDDVLDRIDNINDALVSNIDEQGGHIITYAYDANDPSGRGELLKLDKASGTFKAGYQTQMSGYLTDVVSQYQGSVKNIITSFQRLFKSY